MTQPEVESSRTHFEVLGLGLEASSPRKLPCPRLEDSTIFEPLKFRWNTPETCGKSAKTFFLVSLSRDRLKKNFWRPFSPEKLFWRHFFFEIAWKIFLKTFFFWRTLASGSLALVSRGSVLGLEIFLCPWNLSRALCPRLHLWTQQMPKHFQTSTSNVTYDKTEKCNRNNDKNRNNRSFCRMLWCDNGCRFFCEFQCDW